MELMPILQFIWKQFKIMSTYVITLVQLSLSLNQLLLLLGEVDKLIQSFLVHMSVPG